MGVEGERLTRGGGLGGGEGEEVLWGAGLHLVPVFPWGGRVGYVDEL